MIRTPRSVVAGFAVAALSFALAVVAGIAWLGQPLRLVNLLTIVGLSATAGVSWAQAVALARRMKASRSHDAVAGSLDDRGLPRGGPAA